MAAQSDGAAASHEATPVDEANYVPGVPGDPTCAKCVRNYYHNPGNFSHKKCDVSHVRCSTCAKGNRAVCFAIQNPHLKARIKALELRLVEYYKGKISPSQRTTADLKRDVPEVHAEAYELSRILFDGFSPANDAAYAPPNFSSAQLPGVAFVPPATPKRKRNQTAASSSPATSSGDVVAALDALNDNVRLLVDTTRVLVDCVAAVAKIKRPRFADEVEVISDDEAPAPAARKRVKPASAASRKSDRVAAATNNS